MDSFAPQMAPTASPDPSKHVNYTLGMVLGVDDFTQEFAYLSGHDQLIVRDLLGYGTASGLRVSVEGENNNPRINPRVVVGAGVAVNPLGQLIRITSAQCAYLKDWVRDNKQRVKERLKILSPVSPLDGTLPLYVVLCYRACPVDMVPIPGEPCRTEEDSMAPSRLKDDFRLELRLDAPYQIEEVALRDFVAWMSKSIEITNAPGQTLDIEKFQDEIRNAVLISGSPPASPPHLPPDFMIDLPLIHLRVPPADACRYLRAAFRLWVTELRPLWRPSTLGENPCCADKKDGDPTDKDCVLLARLDVPVIEDTLTGELLIDATEDVRRDEETRPFLAHLRFLQEWLLCGTQAEAAGKVVAAGRFDAQGNSVPAPLFSFNLQAQRLGNAALNLFLLRFNSFDSKRGYVVKGTPLASGNAQPVSFEVIPSNDALVLPFGREAQGGIIVRVRQSNGQPAQGFMVEISQF